MSSTFQVSILQLHMLLSEHDSIPWEALSYLIGGVSYGGRVTDEWDRRCLHALLGRFFCTEALEPDYSFSPDKVWILPYKFYVLGQIGLSKQCRPRSDCFCASEEAVRSGSTLFAIPSASFGCINVMLHQTFLFLGQLWQLFEVSQILEFLRYDNEFFAQQIKISTGFIYQQFLSSVCYLSHC